MSVKSGIFPVGIVLRLGLKSGTFAVWCQKPVRVKSQKVAYVHILRMLERPGGKADRGYRETLHLCLDTGVGTGSGCHGQHCCRNCDYRNSDSHCG